VENVSPLREPNIEAMREHLHMLFGRALVGLVEITVIPTETATRRSIQTRFFDLDSLDEASAWAASVNREPGCNVYVGAALRAVGTFPGKAAEDSDFLQSYVLWADADDGDQTERAKKAYRTQGAAPPRVVVTGRTPTNRAQLWWPLEAPIVDINELKSALRGIAQNLGTDPRVCTGKQLMRLAGGLAWPKKEGRTLELTEWIKVAGARDEFDLQFLLNTWPPCDRVSVPAVTTDVVVAPTGSLGLGEEKIMDGRELYAFKLIRANLREFIGTTGSEPTADELYNAVAPTYFKRTDQVRPGRDAQFLKVKVVEALRAYHAGQIPGMRTLDEAVTSWADRVARGDPLDVEEGDEPLEADDSLFEILSMAQIKNLPPAEYIVKDMIAKDGLGIVYAAPASWKSFICYDLALSIAYGLQQWIGREIKAVGSVLYIANEGSSGVQKRISAWQQKHKCIQDTDRFGLIRAAMSFMDRSDISRLEKSVQAHVERNGPVSVIFVDTVSRVIPGAEENGQKDMTIFIAACDRLREAFGATVIGVHHTNKQGEMRGSTVLLGQADFVFRIDRNDDGKGGVMTCEKQKDAEDGWKVAFEIERHEWLPEGRIEPVSSLTINWTGSPATTSPHKNWPGRDVLRGFQRDIADAFGRGKPLSLAPQTKREGRYAPTKLASFYRVPAAIVEDVLQAWMINDVIEIQAADSHSKVKGLQVIKWLD